MLMGFSFSLFRLPWCPQNVSSPDSSWTLINAWAPQTSQRSELVSRGRELVSMGKNIAFTTDTIAVFRAVSLFAKWQE